MMPLSSQAAGKIGCNSRGRKYCDDAGINRLTSATPTRPRWPRSQPLPRRDAFYFPSRLRLRGDECTKKPPGLIHNPGGHIAFTENKYSSERLLASRFFF